MQFSGCEDSEVCVRVGVGVSDLVMNVRLRPRH